MMNMIPEIFYFIYLEGNSVSKLKTCFQLLSANVFDLQESAR